MILQLFLGSLRLRTLCIQLLVEQTELRLRLLLVSLGPRQLFLLLGFHSFLLSSKEPQIVTESLCIPPDALEVGFQGCDRPSNVAFLCGYSILLGLSSMKFLSFVR